MTIDAGRYRRALEALLGVPASEGNRVDVLRNGGEIFPAMLNAIQHADHSVDLLTFIYWTGDVARQFAQALIDRAGTGVRVRLILDAVGARHMDRGLVGDMEAAGVTVHWFRPPSRTKVWKTEHRTHRKILVCDERVGFTGGVGIAEEWEGDARDPGEWRDTHLRVEGPAVAGLRAGFATDWLESGHTVFDERDRFPELSHAGDVTAMVIRGSAEYGWNDMVLLKRSLVDLAQQRVRIASPYFSPDQDTADRLCRTAQRGVEVQVLVPGPHTDKRIVQVSSEEKYGQLIDAGVRIFRYQPTMLHTKIVTVDGVVADVGSANFNSRSLAHDEEIDVVALDGGVAEVLDAHFDEDLERAEEVVESRWEERSVVQQTAEKVMSAVDEFI